MRHHAHRNKGAVMINPIVAPTTSIARFTRRETMERLRGKMLTSGIPSTLSSLAPGHLEHPCDHVDAHV